MPDPDSVELVGNAAELLRDGARTIRLAQIALLAVPWAGSTRDLIGEIIDKLEEPTNSLNALYQRVSARRNAER
jgi:hypothetical protein